MTINQILTESQKQLSNIPDIRDPRFEADILLSNILDKPREWLLAHGEERVGIWAQLRLKQALRRRWQGFSLAYVIGTTEFYGHEFRVNKHTLVPRPETELMVDEVRTLVRSSERSSERSKIIIADIGTGSGCVIISLAKELQKQTPISQFPNFQFLASDISKPALKVAKKNAKEHNINGIIFFQGNLLEPITRSTIHDLRFTNLIICANLPYLTPDQIKTAPTIKKEPRLALEAGPDGLKYYHELFEQIKNLINSEQKPKSITIHCEINPDQTVKIKALASQILPNFQTQTKKDLRGLERLFIVSI